MRAEYRSDPRATGPPAAPLRSRRSSSIFLQRHFLKRHFGILATSIGLSLLLALLWPLEARAVEEDAPGPPAQVENDAADAIAEEESEGDDETTDTMEAEGYEEYDEYEEYEEYEVEPDSSELEVIRITGQASDTLGSDAAQSAVQFGAQDLEALGVADISDIAKVTPNLQITVAGATNANFFIRGVGLADFSANSASAVAIYQDGVPLNATALQLVGLFDVSSVVVLRGPQGAGSGRNATAGAIKIQARKPTGQFMGQLRTTFGGYLSDDARKALIQDYEGAIEVPIVDDLLHTRVSFRLRAADPYMTNGCGGTPSKLCADRGIGPGLPSAVGDEGSWAARGVFRFQPQVLEMDWLLSVYGGRLDQQSTLGQAMGTGPTLGRQTSSGPTGAERSYIEPDQQDEFRFLRQDLGLSQDEAKTILADSLASGRPLDRQPYRGDYNRIGQTTRDTWGTSLTGNLFFDEVGFLGPVSLQTITGYDGYNRFRETDQDFTPNLLFESTQADEAWQFFQELKATGELSDGVLRWELGGYYLMEQLEYESNQQTRNAAFDFVRTFDQDLWSFAFYAGFGWDFLENFTLSAGIRYNWERKSFNFIEQQVGVPPMAALPQEETWSSPTGLIEVTYRFNDSVSTYLKYTRGWKGGHFNANRPNVPPAEPEDLDSVEWGFNGSWLDARLNLAGSLFYYKYKNYQVFLFENAVASPPILEIINANDAEQYGAEIELDLLPLQDWEAVPELLSELRVEVRFGWLNSQFLDFVNLIERIDPQDGQIFQQVVSATGNQLPNSPEFKLSAALQWPFSFGRFGTVIPRYDFAWTDDIFFDPYEGRGAPSILSETDPNFIPNPEFMVGQRAYALHSLRLSWLSEAGNIEVSGWVRNLMDQRYKTYAFDASIFAAVVLNFVGQPRTVGVDISFRF